MNNFLLLSLFLLFTSCEFSKQYKWNKNLSLDQILKKSNGKIILLDFKTEW